MADLMTESSQFADLEKKYGGFETPDCEVLAGGRNVTESLGLAIERVTADLAAEGQSSYCEVTVWGAYDLVKRTFSPDLIDAFSPGEAVTLKLGYMKRESVFQGFVWSQRIANAEDGPARFIVGCMDARRLMMENHAYRHFLDKTVADIVGEVFGAYGRTLKGGTQVEAPSGKLEFTAQAGSDFVFLEELAERTGRLFTVFNGKAYFIPFGKNKTPCVTLEMGEHIRHLELERSYRNLSVEVYSPSGTKTVSGKSEPSDRSWQKNAGGKSVISLPWPGLDADGCKALAQSLYDRRMDGAASGRLRTVGLPELVPGRVVKITKAGGGYDGGYRIKSVRHVMDETGYTTELELGGSV